MNTSMPLDAAMTALTVLAEHLNDGFTADPARLRTAAEIACAAHGLPENQGPAIAQIASFWIAVAGGYVPASPGSSDPEGDNLARLWRQPARQASDLNRATWMIRQWRAYHDLADGPEHRAADQRRESSGAVRRPPPADPAAPRRGERLYRVVQYYDSWPFKNDSRVPRGSKSHKRTETFRTFGPVVQRLARANVLAQYQRQNGGDWSALVAIAEQLTDDGWQPIDVDLLQEGTAGIIDSARRPPRTASRLAACAAMSPP